MMKFHKDTSVNAQKYITAARAVLYSAKTIPVMRHIVAGAGALEASAAPFIATLFMQLQTKLGPLTDQREQLLVVMHICQDVAEIAHEMRDPDAKNPSKAAARIFTAVARVLSGQHPSSGQPVQQGTMGQMQGGPPQAPQPPAAPMQQLQGAPQ